MRIKLQRSLDVGYFSRMVNHPDISPFVRDDSMTGDIDLSPIDSADNYLLKALVDDQEAGFAILLVKGNDLELHSGLLKPYRGRIAIELGRLLVEWAALHTAAMRLLTWAWDSARNVILVTKAIGFREDNRELWPFSVAGVRVNRVNFSIDLNNLRTV